MSNIVERLRAESEAALAMRMSFKEQLQAWETMRRAAAEIERLREEVELWKDRYESAQQAMRVNDEHLDKMLNEGGL